MSALQSYISLIQNAQWELQAAGLNHAQAYELVKNRYLSVGVENEEEGKRLVEIFSRYKGLNARYDVCRGSHGYPDDHGVTLSF